jgi:hypothetical protein
VGRTVRNIFRVTVDIDTAAWLQNYGVVGSVDDDIESVLTEVIQEQLTAWIANTGNLGAVAVARGGRVSA